MPIDRWQGKDLLSEKRNKINTLCSDFLTPKLKTYKLAFIENIVMYKGKTQNKMNQESPAKPEL